MIAPGYIQLRRFFSKPPKPAACLSNPSELPNITIIRPVVGIEPKLYQCLASTFQQTYPSKKLSVSFCIPSRTDPALPVLERLLEDYPQFDARICVEDEDPALRPGIGHGERPGPNPKIRNMSRAYREATSDLVWIIDCNVWVGKGVAGRMVETLCGFSGKRPYKFVHQLPIVVDMPPSTALEQTFISSSSVDASSNGDSARLLGEADSRAQAAGVFKTAGGRLEELFMSSSHPKFYTAINTLLIAPCIVGKSSMFRRSHLDYLTKARDDKLYGIDYFSYNICEDHLIGDLLWKNKVEEEKAGKKLGKHAMLFGDLAIQPMAGMSVPEYVARRVRWLRVRKFTVMLATFVEHATESLVDSLLGAYSVTTLPWFANTLGIPQTWTAFGIFWLCSVLVWMLVDWTQYILLHSARSVEIDEHTPEFARPPPRERMTRRRFPQWLAAWLGRELLAFPIWLWAVFGGVTVTWRGKRFWVGVDMKVHEIIGDAKEVKGRGTSGFRDQNGTSKSQKGKSQ